ncbi:MAG TPA: biotin--[acetyl-CoA-carboxylase] ligase [Candidatus Aquabacterium excrementipullorum]|nr:biotin--[acetyl-CoA-carboxylase] ligase [Candidatus Aquabacterium excrementipullorum]
MEQGLADLNRAAEQLWLAAQPAWPTLSIEVLPEVGSTNAHALALGRDGARDPVVVTAWRQTAGRGRAGRQWDAQPGQALTLSLALPLALADVPGGGSALSLAVGLWTAQALDGLRSGAAPLVQLKWPNDLWVADRKLGGILIEAIQGPALTPEQRWVVIGLGLNLRGTPDALAGERTDTGTALGLNLTPGQAMATIVAAWLAGLRAFEHTGFAPLREAYAARDALQGRPVALWRHMQPAPVSAVSGTPADGQGIARGVDANGTLLVDDGQGHLQAWSIGEVSVRPRAQG